MTATPLVSVVMSVYNGERYLEEAIRSILNQTFRDFEFIIINDGSTDGTDYILARYQQADDRIRVYHQQNQGLIASLNRGCRLAQGKYIARMDADDVSLPERLAREVDYLEIHAEIGVLGTWIQCIDDNGKPVSSSPIPTMPGVIGWRLIFADCLAHPSIMMRRDLIEWLGFYSPEAPMAEDYDLWVRAGLVTRIANIPETLLRYRIWQGSMSSRNFQITEQSVAKIMRSTMARLLGSEPPAGAVEYLRRMVIGQPLSSLEQIESAASLIQQLYQAYLKTHSLNRAEAKEIAQDAGERLCFLAVSAARISPRKGLVIFTRAVRLKPRPSLRRIIARGVRILVRKA